MHNGQVGGYAGFRRQVDMMIDEGWYCHRHGTTDSEALFLLALGEGLERCPRTALERATGRLERLSRDSGATPHMRMTIALSDGKTLYAARYASDEYAPSLYVRHLDHHHGSAVVSEPLEDDSSGWEEVPPGRFVTVTPYAILSEDFRPAA